MILFKTCPINIRIFSLFLNNIYISITRGDRIILVDGTVSSRVKPTRNGVCVHQNRWPALESCQVVEICRCNLVLFSSPSTLLPGSRSCSFARKIYRYTKLSIHHELPYRIFISLVSIGHCLTYRQPTVGPIRAGREYRSPVPRPFQPQCRQHLSRLW